MTTKTSVYLDDDQKRALSDLARRSGVSEAELLREGVRMVIAAAERPKPRAGSARVATEAAHPIPMPS